MGEAMSSKRKALGRGLASLIPAAEPSEDSTPLKGLTYIPLDQILANPFQPRKTFDDPRIEELAESIKRDGLIQPIVVRKKGSKFELIAGERRWRASQRAGLGQIPAIVKEATDLQSLVLALEENIQRADLNPLEEALAYEQLVDEFGMTQEEVAKRVGRERSTVANTLRLLRLPQTVKEDLVSGQLSMGHARALLALEDAELMLVARQEILDNQLSVRATEVLVARLKKDRPKKKKKKGSKSQGPWDDPDSRRVLTDLRQAFGTKVAIRGTEKKGRIELEFYSRDDLNRLLQLLLES